MYVAVKCSAILIEYMQNKRDLRFNKFVDYVSNIYRWIELMDNHF